MGAVWTPDVIRFCLLNLLGAAWLVQHGRLLLRALGSRSLSPLARFACLFPPVLLAYAVKNRAQGAVWLWWILLAIYGAVAWLPAWPL